MVCKTKTVTIMRAFSKNHLYFAEARMHLIFLGLRTICKQWSRRCPVCKKNYSRGKGHQIDGKMKSISKHSTTEFANICGNKIWCPEKVIKITLAITHLMN